VFVASTYELMATPTISSVVNASFLNRLTGLASGASSSNPAAALTGKSKVSISDGLRTGARAYGNAVQGLNSVISFLNLSKDALEKLDNLTDKLISLTERATKLSTSQDSRNSLNREFKKLGVTFQEIIEEAKIGQSNYLDRDGLSQLFTTIGLDKESSDTIAAVFEEYVYFGEDTKFASESARKPRPVNIPPSAFQGANPTESATETYTGITNTFATGINANFNLADVDSDGVLDVLATSLTENTFSVHRGNGDGTFKARVSYTSIGGGYLDVGDINRDGFKDVLISSDYPMVFLGNPDGTFAAGYSVAVSGAPLAKLNDVNGDTILDIVSTETDTVAIRVALGNGDGFFQSEVTYTPPSDATLFSVVDINGDGKKDLVLDQGTAGIGIVIGNGDGSFLAGQSYVTGTTVSQVFVADLNNDTKLDIVTRDPAFTNDTYHILYGNGDGTFQLSISNGGADLENIHYIDVSDYDGDGTQEILLHDSSSEIAEVAKRQGDGSYAVAYSFSTGVINASSSIIRSGDLNGDGTIDIAFLDSVSGTIRIALGQREPSTTTVSRNITQYDTLFETERTIRSRPASYEMLADLKELKNQIAKNQKAIDNAIEVVAQNADLVRAAGFSFLKLSNSVTSETAEEVAKKIQRDIRRDAPAALNQLENLEAMTVAALTLESTSFLTSGSK
jgi:hypothetical protein